MASISKYQDKSLSVPTGKDSLFEEVRIGDMFITPNSSYSPAVRVKDIKKDEESKDLIVVERARDWECTVWESESTYSMTSFLKEYGKCHKVDYKGLQDYFAEADKVISGEKSIEEYQDKEDSHVSEETSLMERNSDAVLNALMVGYKTRIAHVEQIRNFVKIRMEQKKAELDILRRNLEETLAVFRKKVSKIMSVIASIELYLGIGEELFQIQDGEKAPADTPITFRQQVLYMDEEIGHWKDGGLDYSDIKWFDEWLVTNDNYKKLIEDKGMVVFRPRRHPKDYNSGDPIADKIRNQWNYMTYLLIRNGECIYRVYTEHIVIEPRLFPKKSELQELMNKINETHGHYSKEAATEKVDDLMYKYKKRALLMQGLIDRTEVFHPLPAETVNIFNMEELGDKVRFIYDDEATFPSGRKSFKEWMEEINSKIKVGSRILITHMVDSSDVNRRIYYYCNEYNIPASPGVGIYEVESWKVEETVDMSKANFEKMSSEWDAIGHAYKVVGKSHHQYLAEGEYNVQDDMDFRKRVYEDGVQVKSVFEHMTIMYNPKDEVYGDWGSYDPHIRKNRIRFRIHQYDDFLLNYDQIDLDDIEFYLTSRVDRPNYLHMMPTLVHIKEHLLVERTNEEFFARMVFDNVWSEFNKISKADHGDKVDLLEMSISNCIDWWKYKNKWKRGITKDDAKAYRMIVGKLRSSQFKVYNSNS